MRKYRICLALALVVALAACNDDADDNNAAARGGDAPKVVSTIPVADATEVPLTDSVITVTFDKDIFTTPVTTVSINGTYVNATASGAALSFHYPIRGNTTYTVKIARPTVHDADMNFALTYSFSFTTETVNAFDTTAFDIAPSPCTPDASEQTVKVYNFLKENFGKKIVSAAMARINWNTDEAQFMDSVTGKWPAINCFDFVHHIFSAPLNASTWIDYTNTKVVEDWWNQGGLVACMWHWNVPCAQPFAKNFDKYAFYASGTGYDAVTTFDASRATTAGTYENGVVNRDLDIVAGYLKALRDKGIPVIWRPLHEASGQWFWWGAKGSDAYKALWVYMFRYFEARGLNNLIWVWTSATGDADWYPGDAYVDVIAYDSYPATDIHASRINQFKALLSVSKKKIFAMAECGGLPDADATYTAGDMWSWAMPWYGVHTENEAYNGASYLKKFLNNAHVVTRDQLPSFK